ncbi:MAG: YgiT-type zinc finger protein [Anaerolineales bacterium]|nr:YgiT-type zinc finger protein [Anaerolineales bacterium]MCA9975049.1 YgiT-type zinc finger protein [Anaerolineales bacterium]
MVEMICDECRVGRYQKTTTPYTYWIGDQILVFPNAPAFVCDVCKHTIYDSHFLNSMEYVLDDLTEQVRKRAVQVEKPVQGGVTKWTPTRSGR